MRRGLLATVCGLLASGLLVVACAQTDAGVTTSVKTKFTTDDMVKAHQIDVDTREGVVTLTGSVDSEAARNRAVELARATEGVKDVVDNLRVEPGTAPTAGTEPYQTKPFPGRPATGIGDASITATVKTKLLADTDVAGLRIDVDTSDGVVTLTGEVNTAMEKEEAMRLAREVNGVKRVIDKLTLKGSPSSH